MGPRLFSRGNLTGATADVPTHYLQWGRDSSVAEILWYVILYQFLHAFNGAATLQSRK